MLTIETRSLDRLTPYVQNARTHSEDQVAQIAASIAEFGFVNPVLIGADDVIVAGHGRVLQPLKDRAERILKDLEDRKTTGLAAMDLLAALAAEKDAAAKAAKERRGAMRC